MSYFGQSQSRPEWSKSCEHHLQVSVPPIQKSPTKNKTSQNYVMSFKQSFDSHRKESLIILQGGFIRTYNILLAYVSPALLMFLVFSSVAGTGGFLTPRRVFTTLSLILILRTSTLGFLARCVFFISEANVAFTRIQVG